jgi:hypothetical protein
VKHRKSCSYAFGTDELDAVETVEGSDGSLIVGGPGLRFTAASAAEARKMALSLTALYLELDAREARNTRSVAYTDPDTKESRIAELSTEQFRSFLWMIGGDKPKPVSHFLLPDVHGNPECACGYIPAITGVCSSLTFREAQRLAVNNHIKEQTEAAKPFSHALTFGRRFPSCTCGWNTRPSLDWISQVAAVNVHIKEQGV